MKRFLSWLLPQVHQPVPAFAPSKQGRRRWQGALLCTLVATTPCIAQAATNSNRVDVTLQASVLETLTLTVANPVYAFGVVTPGVNNAAPAGQSLAVVTTWLLNAGRNVKLYAYFDSATSAMSGVLLGDTIPTSAFTATLNGGAAQSFTQNSPFTSGSTAALLYSVPVTSANAIVSGRVDTLALAMNLSGVSLHSDTYTGTLHLQVQAL